jgi:hypothetical protein
MLPSGHADLTALRGRCPDPQDPEQYYEIITSSGVETEASFRWIDKLWRGPREALAQLRLPDAVAMDGYRLHPALVDACFQVAGATFDQEEETESVLPFSIKVLRQERAVTGTS